MKKYALITCLLCFVLAATSQNRKVLLEEFTGAHCGQCPMGSYMVDSMLDTYPDLIAVSLHSYGIYDAMNFSEIDTINEAFAQGAPLAAIDRICSTPPSNNTAIYQTMWDSNIQQRLAVPVSLSISVVPTWTSSTRNISALITVNMLTNLPAGDYRITLYVVEDSVNGLGSGYDQASYYNTTPGPFFGMGNPIVGYVHRHVARALLPSPWGQTGIIPSAPTTGQTFTTTINYTLPATYNENRVTLIAVVNEVSADHAGDEILNAEQTELLGPTDIADYVLRPYEIYVNPGWYFINSKNFEGNYEVCDVTGKIVASGALTTGEITTVDMRDAKKGLHILIIYNRDAMYTEKLMITWENEGCIPGRR